MHKQTKIIIFCIGLHKKIYLGIEFIFGKKKKITVNL